MLSRSPAFLLLALAGAAWLTGALPAAAADPHYESLLREGSQDAASGEHAAAATKLEIACFGLLDEPPRLVDCLMRLALAHEGAGLGQELRSTLARLSEVETRFAVYGELAGGDLKRSFEELLRRTLGPGELAASPFPVAPAPEGRTATRRRESRSAAGPSTDAARAELARGRTKRAGRILDELLAAAPTDPELLCLRASASPGDCDWALRGLPSCPGLPASRGLAASYLECLVKRNMTSEATAFVALLEPAVASHWRVERWARRVPAAQPPARAAAHTEPEPEAAADSETPAATDGGQPPLGVVVRVERDRASTLTEIRAAADAARQPEELEEPLALATALADAHPEWSEAQYLAGEIAYRASLWSRAVELFRRGGRPGPDRPLLLFYMAVALFESGDPAAAAEILEAALPGLETTPFVESYRLRILAPQAPS